jgi:flagellar hook-associated protein 1 FlgK
VSISVSSIALSGIQAAEAGISAVQSNIANASNPDYSVESVNLAARSGLNGAGAGVNVVGTFRAQAPLLSEQINQNQSSLNFNSAFTQVAQVAQNTISPSSGQTLSTALENLFNAFTNLSATPEDPTARGSVISAAGTFAQTARQISSELNTTSSAELAGLNPLVDQVNQASAQIAQLNGEITAAQSSNAGGAPALLDQRDALVNQLSGLIGATADANGNVSVGGTPLVSGTTALSLSTTGSGAAVTLQVSLTNGSLQVPTGQLGGTIGGVLAGAASVNNIRGQLNSAVASVATAINTRHQAGYGLDGSTGNALFLIPGGDGPIALNPAITTQNLAAASSAAGAPGDGSNATALAAISNQAGIDGTFPDSTPAQTFGQMISGFGASLQSALDGQNSTSATLQSLQQLKGSITGVSLNAELTKLVQYSNALQAAGRALQATNDLTTFLIQVVGQ